MVLSMKKHVVDCWMVNVACKSVIFVRVL